MNASPPGARFVFDTDDEPLFDGARLLPPVAGGTTDAVGQTELWFPSDLEACTLRVTGAEHLERIEARPLLRAGQVHEVVVEIGARVEGRCLVAGYGDRPLALQFVRDGSTTSSAVLALLGPQGEFRSPPLAPGAQAIHLSVPADGDLGIRAPLEPPLQYVALGEGEVLRLDLDARAWAPGSLAGSVRLDGAAPPGGSLLLLLVLPSLKLRFGRFALDAQGAFATEGLPPGRWTALLYAGGPAYLELGETFELAGGERREVQLEFASMRRVLRLLKADGKSPMAGQAIVVVSSEPAFPATADAGGRVRFERALEGEIEFFFEGDEAARYRAFLPEPGEEHARDVVLPIEP